MILAGGYNTSSEREQAMKHYSNRPTLQHAAGRTIERRTGKIGCRATLSIMTPNEPLTQLKVSR